VRLWDVATWGERGCLRDGHEMTITSVAFSPDGKPLASAGRDQQIVLWELPGGRRVRAWQAHPDVVHDVVFRPNGVLVSVGKGGVVKSWDVSRAAETARCICPGNPLSAALSPDGNTLATGGYGGPVAVCADLDHGRTTTLHTVRWVVRALAWSPLGSPLVAACDCGRLRVWDMDAAGRDVGPPRTLGWGTARGRAAAFARQGALLVTASEDEGTVELWDLARLGGARGFRTCLLARLTWHCPPTAGPR
jgi:WD40 repeat protein